MVVIIKKYYNMEKTRDYQLFMTKKDEQLFCKTLREFNSNIYFLDTTPSLEFDIEKRLFEDVSILDSKFFSIVNFDLIKKNYRKTIKCMVIIIILIV
jgi:hypothetical protein